MRVGEDTMVKPKSHTPGSSGRCVKTVIGLLGCAGFYAQSLRYCLERDRKVLVVDLRADRKDPRIGESKPDVILVDTSGGSGVELVRDGLKRSPGSKFIALGASLLEIDLLALLETGVSGLVTREGSLQDLRAAIHDVAQGGFHLPERARVALVGHAQHASVGRREPVRKRRFSPRETEVLRLLDQHLTNKQIAARLNIHPDTVKTHVHNILAKAGVHRRDEIAGLPEE
jgi:DNA-binding NarL/FixJ family response regulator